jgi:hypothetical protein
MAVSRPAPPYCTVIAYCGGDQKQWSGEYWYKPDTSMIPSDFSPAALAQTFNTLWGPFYQSILTPTFNFYGVEVVVNFGTGAFGSKAYGTLAGTATGVSLPEDVAAVVQCFTSVGGRSHTGRKFFSMVPEPLTQGSYLSSDGLTLYQTFSGVFLGTTTDQGVGYVPQIYSRKLNTLTPARGIQVIAELGTLRRRRSRF